MICSARKRAEGRGQRPRSQHSGIVGELNGDFMARGEGVNIDFVTTDAAITGNMVVAWVNISLLADVASQ